MATKTYIYDEESWGSYYTGVQITFPQTGIELTKENTLSLYLYGALSRPDNPADHIRIVSANELRVKVDGQAYFDNIGSILPYVMAEKSNDIPNFYDGGFDSQFIAANPNNVSRVVLSANQINSDWDFGFKYVDYGSYQHWEDGTFIYNSSNFSLDPNTQFVAYFDQNGQIIDRRMEDVKYLLGKEDQNGKLITEDNYDYQTGEPTQSDASRFLHGEYHDPFNIGKKFLIDFGSAPVWNKSKSEWANGEVWDEVYYESLKSQAEDWRSFDVAGYSTSLAYWATRGEEIAAGLSGDSGPLKYQVDGHRLVLGTGLNDEIATALIESEASKIAASNANVSLFDGVPFYSTVDNNSLYPQNYVQRALGDYIYTGFGDDNIAAGKWNDVIFGGLGADLLDGGQGYDIAKAERDFQSGVVLTLAAAETGIPFLTREYGVKISTSSFAEFEGDRLFAIELLKLSDYSDQVTVGEIDGEDFGRLAIDLAGGDDTVRFTSASVITNTVLGDDRFAELGIIDTLSIIYGQPPAFIRIANELKDLYNADRIIQTKIEADTSNNNPFNDDRTGIEFKDVEKFILSGQNDEFYLNAKASPMTREVRGEAGNDLLIASNAQYVPFSQGEPPDTPTVLEQRLKLDGGVGDDWLISLGGTGAVLVGGEGRDFLFNTSEYGQLYGDRIDGIGQSTSGATDSDVFWYWPGTFIMDAQQNDILQMFGWPLSGGTNSKTGLPGVDTMANDWSVWSVFYGYTDSKQLIIYDSLLAELGIGPAGFEGKVIVEDFDFGGSKNSWGVPKVSDLGMTFRFQLAADNPNGVEISAFDSLWGYLITQFTHMFRLAKLLAWQPADDPLVLDLDGDGIETVAVHQSGVHFDLDGDYFAEKTGWVGADDGFLVRDLNGNGFIDDITEMFGAPGVSAFAELAELDAVENGGNADGFLTLDDAAFSELQVWRDLDQDGSTDAGELFGLDELDIVSISVTGDGVESITPTGTTLREGASFTRGDGSTGNTYEALFETDATDTIFRGEKGVAEWQRPSTGSGGGSDGGSLIPDAKGLGSMADLAIQAASDFALAETVLSATNAMGLDANGLPSLKQLRADATPVFGAWSQSMELTRELVLVLLNKAVDGTVLVDRAVYVEDATGGYWTLDSGNDVLDSGGIPIARATIEDIMAQAVSGDQIWQMEQMFSPTSRAAELSYREEAPYLATIIDGRAVISDYGIDNGDGSWRLASGNAIVDGNGDVIATPTVADILAMPVGGGSGDGSGATNGGSTEEWRIEAIDFNPYADLPVEEMGVYLIDGTVVDYSIAVTDADGTFHVWSRNLDRALELQHKLGRPGEFNLRNYELDFDNLDEVGSTDDSAYRVEILTAGQFHFASSVFGIDFQPEIMSAVTDPLTSVLSYSVGSFNGVEASQVADDGSYLSVIDPAIELFDALMQNYIDVSRGFAVRLALQGGLSRFARGLNYEAVSDEFTSTTDRELAPMFEAIFEEAPAGATESYDYLVAWREILQVVYPDYHLDGTTNFVTGTLELDEEFVFQMLLPAFENVGIDAELAAVMNALGVDETKLISHDAAATLINGTEGDDFIYLSGGDQTYRGGYGADTYFVGKDFGQDIIEDVEEPLNPWSADILRFTQAKSSDVFATRDGLDLVIEVLGTTDVLRIKGQFDGEKIDPIFGADFSNDTEMVSIVFADGVIWDRFEIAKAVSHPLDSDDLVLGSQAKDLLEGGKGNDIMRGGRDGDIYVIRAGDGIDIINDDNDMPTDDPTEKPDLLQFVGDFSAEDLSLKRIADSDDLEITLLDADGNPTGDVVTIEGQFDWINVFFLGLMFPDTIERIAFADGSFLTETDIMARVLDEAKTDAADAIHGFNNADLLDGGAGDDLLSGHAQDDIYIYGRDYGRDVIADDDDDFLANSYDVLKFKDDLRWTDFVFEREGSSSTITMRVDGTQDAVILQDQYEYTFLLGFSNLIERFDFADGTSWDHTKLAQHVIDLSSTDGDDTLYGFAIADELDGGTGDDRLEGFGGADTYVFARGYGNDTVFDTSSGEQGDTLIMRDIAFGDVTISRAANDLIFTIIDTGERLVLSEQYNRNNGQTNAIEFFEFSDQVVDFRNLNPEDVDLIGTSGQRNPCWQRFCRNH